MIEVYRKPPASPDECVFAADDDQPCRPTSSGGSRPCQFGGNPDCAQCGCIASAGLEAVARHKLPGGIPVGAIYWSSLRVGKWVGRGRADGRVVPPADLDRQPSLQAETGLLYSPDVHEPVSPPEPPGFAPAPPAKCGRCGSSRSG